MTYFSTTSLGRKIASARKALNLTQSELAEQLLVSHQAVSSWENGLTSPDISKLSDLSRILNLSIDELLGNDLGRIITKIEQEEPLEESEVVSIAPLTKPEQLETIVEHVESKPFGIDTLIGLAPFVDTSDVEGWAFELIERTDISKITPLAPFISSKALLTMICNNLDTEKVHLSSLTPLAPFLEEDDLEVVVQHLSIDGDLKDLVSLAPFMSEASLSHLIKSTENLNMKDLVALAPFLGEEDLDACFIKCAHTSPQDLVALAPFVSEEALSSVVRGFADDDSINMSVLTALAPFVDSTVLKEIAKKQMEAGNLENIKHLFPFI